MRAILTYHSLDTSGSVISVHPRIFAEHVRFLVSGRLRVLPLSQIVGTTEDVDSVAITFDDGFANFASDALPLLREHGIPATVFVVAGYAGKTSAWDRGSAQAIHELPLMGWDTLGRLPEQGIEIGAHTVRHIDLTAVSRAEQDAEIAGSAEHLARELGTRPSSFAYPYGRADQSAVSAARVSFARACGTELRPLQSDDDPAELPRLDMFYFRDRGRFEAWGTGAFRRRLWLRAQGRRVRRLATRVGVGR